MTASFVPRRARDIGVAALVTCVAGCSTSPDVVANITRPHFDGPDGGFSPVPPVVECKAGRYEGIMYALPVDGGFPVSFSGTIAFSLVKTTEKEVPVLQSEARLEGMGKDMSSFSADIKSGLGCVAGTFETYMENGLYTVAGGGRTVAFEGRIVGSYYDAKYPSFAGSWTSYLHFTDGAPFVVQGAWNALSIER